MVTPTEADECNQYRKIQNQAEISQPEAIEAIVKQVTIQTATVVVMVLREADERLRLGTNTASLRDAHKDSVYQLFI